MPSDAGQYGVKISNPLGTDTSRAKAIVHKVYAPPKFTQMFVDLQQVSALYLLYNSFIYEYL